MLFEGKHTLLISNEIIAETIKVLRYPRLQKLYALTDEELYNYAQFLQDAGETVILDPKRADLLRADFARGCALQSGLGS